MRSACLRIALACVLAACGSDVAFADTAVCDAVADIARSIGDEARVAEALEEIADHASDVSQDDIRRLAQELSTYPTSAFVPSARGENMDMIVALDVSADLAEACAEAGV